MIKVGNTRRNPLARAIRNAFSPRELFRPTTQGAIYEASYAAAEYKGLLPITAQAIYIMACNAAKCAHATVNGCEI